MRDVNSVASENRTILFNEPITTPFLIPVRHASTPNCINDPFMVDGVCYRVTALSFGSPHGAVIVDDVDAVDVPAIGSALGTHCLFPKGANIVFIQVIDKETIKARLWQLNEGEIPFTLEAVCVAGTAAMMLQKIPTMKTAVLMGGNEFKVEWNKGEGTVSLTGPSSLLDIAG